MSKPPKISKEQAVRELARRKGLLAELGSFRLEDYLFDKQLAFVLDKADFKTAVTTRRSGKTRSIAADLPYTAISHPDVIVLYITLSRVNAKRLIWPEFKNINEQFQLGGKVNESELSITFPNKSRLYLIGASDQSSIENFRGLAIKKVYIDEAQSFPAYIAALIDEVIGPALMDHAGQLIVTGTPPAVLSGYFFDLCKDPIKSKGWSHHFWSFFDNPKLPFLKEGKTHQDMLQRELNRRGVTVDDPSVQREWFGKWVQDENSLVYKYSPTRNHYDHLPKSDWHYIVGLDLGFKDADAIAVLAYSEQHPETYLVEEVVTRGQDISALVGQIETICSKYAVDKIVVDTGGLGKKITEEISKRFSVPMMAAEKQRKQEYIELMNDCLRTGKLMARRDSRFAQDATAVEWDHSKSTPDRRIISDRFHSDIADAVLYAWRESYAYTYKVPKVEPEFGTAAWSDAQSDMIFQAELERLEEAKTVEEDLKERYEPEQDLDSIQRLDRPKIRYQTRFDRKKKLP